MGERDSIKIDSERRSRTSTWQNAARSRIRPVTANIGIERESNDQYLIKFARMVCQWAQQKA